MADNIIQGSQVGVSREYRKGNWTVSETMVLIEAKKMDDERRLKRSGNSDGMGMGMTSRASNKPTELRWKWVEDYCWKKGCLRSQNQCNDKWDNLMRDYKKVRDYDKRPAQDRSHVSYWNMEKTQRKDNSLPTNMLPQIYHALFDVVEKKPLIVSPTAPLLLPPPPPPPPAVTPALTPIRQFQPVVLPNNPPHPTVGIFTLSLFSLSLSTYSLHVYMYHLCDLEVCDSPDSDTSEHNSDSSPAKRRRTKFTDPSPQPEQGATSGASPVTINDVASAISKSASVIAEAFAASEEREERRHRDLVGLHERRLRIEESKAEVNRQGISGLVDAISKLADSIQALTASKPS